MILPFHFYIMETWKLAFCVTIQRGLHSSATASVIEIISDHCHKLEPQLRGLLRLSCFNMAWSRFLQTINVYIFDMDRCQKAPVFPGPNRPHLLRQNQGRAFFKARYAKVVMLWESCTMKFNCKRSPWHAPQHLHCLHLLLLILPG